MKYRMLIPFFLVSMLVLAACSAGETAEPATDVNSEPVMTEEMQDDGQMSSDEPQAAETMAEDDAMMDSESETMADDQDEDAGHGQMEDDMQEMEEPMMDEEVMQDDGMADDSSMMEDSMSADLASWQLLPLTNAATGEEFIFADFQGKTVFVEPMATWCTNCRMQQMAVSEARSQLGDDVVFIGLSLETNLSPDELNQYAQANGFDWTYAVMSNELLSQLADQFGRSITSAPSTPHFLIHPDGTFSDLSTGIHSASEIINEIQSVSS